MPVPLRYPIAVTAVTVGWCAALLPFATLDGAAALLVVLVGVVGYTTFRLVSAVRRAYRPPEAARRVHQRHALTSRSWLEHDGRWTPVYFDPALVTGLPDRVYPAGRPRTHEPAGRLRENPTRPDPAAADRARRAVHWPRRLLLDAQSAVGAPVAGLGWAYLTGEGVTAFAGATVVAATAAVWLAAIHGSDPT